VLAISIAFYVIYLYAIFITSHVFKFNSESFWHITDNLCVVSLSFICSKLVTALYC